MDDLTLMIPGPVSVNEDVLEALSRPIEADYGEAWVAFYDDLRADLQTVFQTRNDIYLVTGPGSAALEMGLSSIAAAGETVVVVNNGFFGLRLCRVAEAYEMNVVQVKAPSVERVGAEQVGSVLDEHPEAVAVVVVHHDTTTGVQNDIAGIAQLAHERGALTMVDAVSSLGGIDLPVDEWGVDICVTVANKCLGAAPGVSPISISPRAWEVVDSKETRGWFLNLRTWRYYLENFGHWHPLPATSAINTAYAFRVAIQSILEEGLPQVLERHQNVGTRIRSGLRDLGFEMLLPEAESSPVMTTVLGLPGMDIAHYSGWLLDERKLKISVGLGEYAGKAFRVGHMGRAAHLGAAERFLQATEAYLKAQ